MTHDALPGWTAWSIWALIALLGVSAIGTRGAFILFFPSVVLPSWLRRALRFVPPAVFAALVVPELMMDQGSLNLSWHNERLVAGVVAGAVAAFTRNAFFTIGIGMIALHLSRAIAVY